MSTLMRWNPGLLSRWPTVWDDEDVSSLIPSVSSNLEVYETEDEVVVKANVAGVSADKVDITFEKGVLLIQAVEEKSTDEAAKKYFSKLSTSYSYKVAVPGDIDQSKDPTAEVTKGIITITFKKAEAAKPRKVKVTAMDR